MTDVDETARLRARVAELEAQLEAERAAPTPEVRTTPRSSRARSAAAVALITVACLLAPVSVASVWASTVLSDTDQYVETVAPIADDPGVQSAIADAVTVAIMENLDVAGVTTTALDTLADLENMPPRVADALPALAAPLTRGIEGFVNTQATELMASEQFGQVWDEVNRVAHTQVVKLLEGNEGGAVSAQDNTITLNLAPIIAEVKARLVDRGFELAAQIPEIDKSFVLVESEAIGKSQRLYAVLNALGAWLPFLALAFFTAGVFLAHDRRRALMRGALGVAVAVIMLGVALTLFRMLYVETTPADILSAESAGNVFDTLVRFLRTGVRALAVLGLLVALAAFLTGPSDAAAGARSGLARVLGSIRGNAEAKGWLRGPVPAWVAGHRKALRITILFAGGLGLMFWERPTVGVVLTVALLVAFGLLVVELLAGAPAPAGTAAAPGTLPQQPAAVPEESAAPATQSEKEDVPSG